MKKRAHDDVEEGDPAKRLKDQKQEGAEAQNAGFSGFPGGADPSQVPVQGVLADGKFDLRVQVLSVRVLVGSKSCGSLIGKGGATINRLRQESGATIDVANTTPGATKRIVTVTGSSQQVSVALNGIAAQLRERKEDRDKKAASGQQQQQLQQQQQQQDQPVEAGGQDAKTQSAITLLIPNTQIGGVLGKGGATINATRSSSGATIKVSSQPLENSTEKTILIQGDPSAVYTAIFMLCSQLAELPDKRPATVPYVPQPPTPQYYDPTAQLLGGVNLLNQFGVNNPFGQQPLMQPYGEYGQLGGGLGLGMGAGPYGASGSNGALLQQQQQQTQQHHPQLGGLGLQTVTVSVPDDKAGNLIGRKGATINSIRQRSGAQVKISQSDANKGDRVVTVTGTTGANEAALALIYEIMHQ
jgi:predicted RNA-binding protein YlqC (UPF0109 family)